MGQLRVFTFFLDLTTSWEHRVLFSRRAKKNCLETEKGDFLSLAVFHRIHANGHKGFQNLANWLSFKLAVCNILLN